MEIRLFGKSLFEIGKSKADALISQAQNPTTTDKQKSKYLPDFYKGFEPDSMSGFISVDNMIAWSGSKESKKKKKAEPKKKTITPKGAHELRLLHDQSFTIKTDPKYVDEQIEHFRDKLELIVAEEYDMRNGVKEIRSVLTRMENRKQYGEHEEFFSQFPYTTTSKAEELVTKYDNLQIGQIAQFIADMPKEATDAMKRYSSATKEICGLQAVFYIIADKKDFKKTTKRRDPILLAQSPFGHFWQILGAWDKEMLMVDEL